LIKQALEKELNIAREIQENMLPKKAPDVPGLDLAGSLTPATAIGGDIYDFLTLDKKGAYIFIADVTGHGVPAGMIANVTHSTLYSFAQVYEKTDEIMKAMNTVIHAKSKRNMFATALLAHWDEKKHLMNYCNAGHEQIVYYDASKKEVSLHGKGGMPLGMIANLTPLLKENSLELHPGDVLLFYTDGIPEAWRTEKENLGMERLEAIAKQAAEGNKDAASIRDAVLKDVTKFRNNYPQQDDITLVVIKAK
jgi:sigma-B regulation protein RsbU (phosphoserine phosphatase)